MKHIGLLLLSLLFALPLAKKINSAGNTRIIYKIKRGDSLSVIARRFKVSERAIKRINKLRNSEKIFAGKRLVIPSRRKRNNINSYFIRKRIQLRKPLVSGRLVKGYRNYGDEKNFGLQYSTSHSAKILASRSGRVVRISYLRGFGNYILVDHGDGWMTMYSHVKDIKVVRGQQIKTRAFIAKANKRKFLFLLSYKGNPVNPTSYF